MNACKEKKPFQADNRQRKEVAIRDQIDNRQRSEASQTEDKKKKKLSPPKLTTDEEKKPAKIGNKLRNKGPNREKETQS